MNNQERLQEIAGKWGRYDIEEHKGRKELGNDFTWLTQELERSFKTIQQQAEEIKKLSVELDCVTVEDAWRKETITDMAKEISDLQQTIDCMRKAGLK
ncbi:hypothetical protein [Metabacillus sp. 84]|uniref:hypothetical protein n=1 Tax=Metabacillus sp. 84 TaxID=3404705 RepID=UPI003CF9A08D